MINNTSNDVGTEGVSRRRFITVTGSIFGVAALAGPCRRGPGGGRPRGRPDRRRRPCSGPGDRHRLRRLRRRSAARPGRRRRADGRDGHGLGHPGLRRQDLLQHRPTPTTGRTGCAPRPSSRSATSSASRSTGTSRATPASSTPRSSAASPSTRAAASAAVRWSTAAWRSRRSGENFGAVLPSVNADEMYDTYYPRANAGARRRPRSTRPGGRPPPLPVRAGRPQTRPAVRLPVRLRARTSTTGTT